MPLIENIPGATPLDDISELIPTHITTRSELNEWEAANIIKAVRKYLGERKRYKLDVAWLKKVHRDMFDETWEWAGQFRKNNFNIGSDWHLIPEQIKSLVDDLAYWEKGEGDLSVLERGVRLHHRLVKIHPFVNGNGRHARLVSDVYLFNHDHPLPTWPSQELIAESEFRQKYIVALQAADQGNYKLLARLTSGLIGD